MEYADNLPKPSRFTSLRYRILVPLLVASMAAAGIVAWVSSWLGERWAMTDVREHFAGIEQTLRRAEFPLASSVLESLADLTGTHFITLDAQGRILSATVDWKEYSGNDFSDRIEQLPIDAWIAKEPRQLPPTLHLGEREFLAFAFERSGMSVQSDRVERVLTLFDRDQIDKASRRASWLPMATGISTIALLTLISVIVSSRLVGRLIRLQRRVQRIATGDFDCVVADSSKDEIGRLGRSVDMMAVQLDQLWTTVNRQQSERLLHQVAGGMAHQLRNTLTGARMAIELHADRCEQDDDEGMQVAIDQIEAAEQYIRRLVLVASGQQADERATHAGECLADLRDGMASIAKHLRVDLTWDINASVNEFELRDGPTWTAAITNLLQNAMQAGDQVTVTARLVGDHTLGVVVADNGPGVDETIADKIFEPFVTGKPDGIGLGLAVVRRAADNHSGSVHCRRVEGRTEFEIKVKSNAS